jgi:hypothetical protein
MSDHAKRVRDLGRLYMEGKIDHLLWLRETLKHLKAENKRKMR